MGSFLPSFSVRNKPLMPSSNLYRGAAARGYATPGSAPIRVETTNNKVKINPAGSGTSEVELRDDSVTELTADGAITIKSGIVTLNKAGVLAATLAAPTAAQQGTRITIISLTDNAHTVTFPTNTLNDGTTGINELATFAAFAGASMTVIAIGTLWYVESLNVVTVTSTV
jgi:hypothetical protein